jgi:Zn-dependent alcohol dehydrogenase
MKDGTTRLTLKRDGRSAFHFLGVSSFAEYAVVSEMAMAKVRNDAPLDKLCLVGCAVVTGVGAVLNTARVTPGKSVAVFGCGGVGLNIIQGANLVSAWPIIAVDTVDSKLKLAREFGASHLVNATGEQPVARIQEISGGGVDFAFEAIGNADVLHQAFDSIDRGGMAIMVGLPPITAKFEIMPLVLFADKALRGCGYGSTNFRHDFPMLVDLYMAKKLKLDELISRTYPLEGINDAFEAMKKGEVARSIITF